MDRAKWQALSLLPLLALACLTASAGASDGVSGTLTRTYVVVEDTDLIGDVVCDVGANPCFSFGASGVELRLNGFSITGKADSATGCGGAIITGEVGITTAGQRDVGVRGPGLVQQFRNNAILVTGSTGARVEDLTVSTNCGSGIRVTATAFATLVQGNRAVRNGSSAAGFPCGGI